MDIVSGAARVVGHAMVTTFGGAGLRIVLDDGPTVEVGFASDPERDLAVDSELTERGIALTLVNFDSAEGRGSATPVLLGDYGDDLLFFHFRAFRFGRTDDRTVHFTFYRAAKSDLSWTPKGDGGGTPR